MNISVDRECHDSAIQEDDICHVSFPIGSVHQPSQAAERGCQVVMCHSALITHMYRITLFAIEQLLH